MMKCARTWFSLAVCVACDMCIACAFGAHAEPDAAGGLYVGKVAGSRPGATTSAAASTRPAVADIIISGDVVAVRAALPRVEAAGPDARRELLPAIRQRLESDRDAILSLQRDDAGRIEDQEKTLSDLRANALEFIASMEKSGAPQTHANRAAIQRVYEPLADHYGRRASAIDGMLVRPDLLRLFRQFAPTDNTFAPSEEARLPALAARALGMTPAAALALLRQAGVRGPANAALHGLWLWRFGRQVALYNAKIEDTMNTHERNNALMVNQYRETMGLVPLEIDPRLVQSARNHSREMIDLGYFAHESPTPGMTEPHLRMRAAGYIGMGFWENICLHAYSAEEAFGLWFDSPGHHRNMVVANMDSMGVGLWDDAWTQNFAQGGRAMLDPQSNVAARGDVLPPQDDGALRKPAPSVIHLPMRTEVPHQ